MRLSEKWHWQVFLNVVKSLPKDQKGMAELLPWQDGLSQRRMKLDHFLSKLDGTLFRGGSLVKKDIVQGNQRIAGKFLAAKVFDDCDVDLATIPDAMQSCLCLLVCLIVDLYIP